MREISIGRTVRNKHRAEVIVLPRQAEPMTVRGREARNSGPVDRHVLLPSKRRLAPIQLDDRFGFASSKV
eukprot:2788109-Alexandrium_andersonii.AAC.1